MTALLLRMFCDSTRKCATYFIVLILVSPLVKPETPDPFDSVIYPAIHRDLSVVNELVRRSSLTVQCMFHKVLLAHRAGE